MTDQNQDPKEIGLYEKIAARTAELLDEGRKTFDEALKKAREEATKAGDYTREQADKAAEYVKRDLAALGKQAEKAKQTLKEVVEPQRVAAGMQSIFTRILIGAADTLSDWAQKAEKNLEYKTGEVTSPGTLSCKECGAEMHLKTTGRIPPCPKCHKTVFRKSY